MLSEAEIRSRIRDGSLVFTPSLAKNQFAQCGVKLTLSGRAGIWVQESDGVIDPAKQDSSPNYRHGEFQQDDVGLFFDLKPGDFVLAITAEEVTLPDDLYGDFDGRSKMARCGVPIHVTASGIWPGHGSQAPRPIVMEIFHPGKQAFRLRDGLIVANLTFCKVEGKTGTSYDERRTTSYSSVGDIEALVLPKFTLERDIVSRD